MSIITIDWVAEEIDTPVTDWPSNCFAIASKIYNAGLVKPGVLRYGFYHGYVSPDSIFAGRPMSRHGWIECPNGLIYDPTRWVFEAVEPYIFFRRPDDGNEYDTGMIRMKAAMRASQTPPEYSPDEKQVQLVGVWDCQQNTAEIITHVLEEKPMIIMDREWTITMDQAFWLSGLPPNVFPIENMKELYLIMEKSKLKMLISVDYWAMVMGGVRSINLLPGTT